MSNSFNSRDVLKVNGQEYEFYRLDAIKGSENLPFSMKVLLENLLQIGRAHV